MTDEPVGRQSAFNEAKALYRMIGDEHTAEELRELIAVPPKIEAVMRGYARVHPEEVPMVNRALMFRSLVLQEFERLVREGAPIVDLPEVEESEFCLELH